MLFAKAKAEVNIVYLGTIDLYITRNESEKIYRINTLSNHYLHMKHRINILSYHSFHRRRVFVEVRVFTT